MGQMVVRVVVFTTIFVASALSSVSSEVGKNTTLHKSYTGGTNTVLMSHPQHHKSPKKQTQRKEASMA